jgi:hypothetical protein
MIHIGGFYRHIQYNNLIVQVVDVDPLAGSVSCLSVGELDHIGVIPYPMVYFMNYYELDG